MPFERIGINAEPTYWHSSAVVAGDFIFTSYQAGVTDDNGHMLDTVEAQTEQTIRNLSRTLASAGAGLEDVVRITLLVRRVADFRRAITVYGRYFGELCPARTTIVTDFLGTDILVQLDAVAYKPASQE